jgi:hypothetical protein
MQFFLLNKRCIFFSLFHLKNRAHVTDILSTNPSGESLSTPTRSIAALSMQFYSAHENPAPFFTNRLAGVQNLCCKMHNAHCLYLFKYLTVQIVNRHSRDSLTRVGKHVD